MLLVCFFVLRPKISKGEHIDLILSTKVDVNNTIEKGAEYCFKYDRDSHYFYRAIMLNDNIIKIECWSKGFLLMPDLFYHDCRLNDVSEDSNEFNWSDEERTSFLIVMRDEENGNWNWNKNENVFYEVENKDYKYNSISDYISGKQVQTRITNKSNNENVTESDNSLSQEEKILNEIFPKDVAKAAIVYTISNSSNLDAFNDDGFTYNMSKMKPYGEKTKYSYSVYDSGKWSVKNSNTWHVDNLVLEPDDTTSGNAYQAIISDITKVDNGYKLSNLKYLILSGKKVTERDIEFYGCKISGLLVNELSEGVLEGKCNLRIKNSFGVWGNYTLHCIVDFNNEKVTKWDVY